MAGSEYDPSYHQGRSERQAKSAAITGSIAGIAVIVVVLALLVAGSIHSITH